MMRVFQQHWSGKAWLPPIQGSPANLILVFGGREQIQAHDALEALRRAHPRALLAGCSTAGEIQGTAVTENELVATLVSFEGTDLRQAEARVAHGGESYAAGAHIANDLRHPGLRHVFVLSDGQKVNGSQLVEGIEANLPKGVAITGGMAGDGARFQQTLVVGKGAPEQGLVVAIGFYGDRIRVGYGSLGGWDPFGPHRRVTKSRGNILYELDGQPALDLYKRYLGEHAKELPAAGLLFPLSVRFPKGGPTEVVRTILGVDEATQSLTFAGDVPLGSMARLMKANFDRLVDGAHGAAERAYSLHASEPGLAILISCIGRKLVLQQRTEQELEAVREVLGAGTPLTGFYSYGEICPASPNANCELHNQTMTITALSET